MAEMSCYGCTHLRYRGSSSVRGLVNGKPVIPLREDERVDPGHYDCAKLRERICRADEMPNPLVSGGECKERR